MEPVTPASPAPQKRMGKFRASYLLATESFELFRKDKEIAWFVIWNSFWVFLITLAFGGGYVALIASGIVPTTDGETARTGMQGLGYLALFAYYLLCCLVTTYYGIALTAVVTRRLEGGDATYRQGMEAARARFGKIVKWSLLSSTVGVVLRFLSDRASWIARLFSFLGGVAWSVATFFIVPVLANEQESVAGSVRRSSQVFVSAWGETIILNFSLGLFFLGLHLFAIVALIALILLTIAAGVPILAAAVVLLYFVFFILAVVVHAVLEKVFRVVLYEYAVHGTIPDNFTPELIMGALKRKDGGPVRPATEAPSASSVPTPPSA